MSVITIRKKYSINEINFNTIKNKMKQMKVTKIR